ncbi:L,D-transpeptidase [Mycobacterium sp. NPDC003323]
MGQVGAVMTGRRHGFTWSLAALVVLSALVTGLSGCGSSGAAAEPQSLDKGTPYADLLVPELQTSVTDGAVGVSVESPVTVSAEAGVLGVVRLVNEDGRQVQGALSGDGTRWETTEPLGYNRQYTLQAEALGLGGTISARATFETHSPQNQTMPYVTPADQAIVGVGQPVAIQFDEDIPDRLAAQRAITVKTTPEVEGAFYWLNNREVRWRPAQYWEPGTKVEVQVKTYGVDLGDGLFGQQDVTSAFTVGDQVIATADDNTKILTVRVNGEVAKTMPISMGKDSTPTDNGTYIVAERHYFMVMDSSTYGVAVNSADGYRTEVNYATRMSYSGIFVHAAPWSVGSQGHTNVSHGCLNASTENAKWFYDNTKRGDIVEVVNTVGSTLSGTDGLGDWNIPWEQWKAGNAAV